MTDAFLSCEGVQKRFGNTVAVADATLQMPRGGFLALLGPSGCGKTTLLRMIAGFERPDAGTIRLGDRVLASAGEFVAPERRRVGLVFQEYALFPHLNVEANVGFGVARGGDRKRKVGEMLDLVGLAGLGKRMPHQLSGGQQQRIALARTLAAEPELVLLDEPFSNLDPALRARVRNEVWQILDETGVTAIVVTHDQEEAFSLPGQVGVMLDGRLLQVGTATDLYLHPADRGVAEFVGDANFIPGTRHGTVVESGLGRLSSRGDTDGDVDIMVRPEDVDFDEQSPVRAEVVGSEYYGHDQVVIFRLEDGHILRVRVMRGGSFEPGATYGIRAPGNVIAYPRP